jgi:hypothetical protein
MVARRLEQTSLAGRQPVLVAPPDLVSDLSERPLGNVELVPFCPFPQMIARLVDAEYAFYWNVFSCSMLVRLAMGRPVFFFDRGHMARAIEPMYEWGLRFHFGDWRPVALDTNQPLTAENLDEMARVQRAELDAIRRKWAKSPSPQDLVDRLMDQGTTIPRIEN